MKTEKEMIKEIEEYLDKEFPKGKTKFRGQAMVLLALARQQREKEIKEKIEKWRKDKGIFSEKERDFPTVVQIRYEDIKELLKSLGEK